ncbi:MAG: pseudouridine synthase [Candidatus Puniceispirillaceae bacterium]
MTQNNALPPQKDSERIAKRIARAGVCSRRQAEQLIEAGKVSVNGSIITSPALNVTAQDKIMIDGKRLPQAEESRLWRYYKPRGLIVSANDEKGRDTIFDNLPDHMPRVISVGRLDYDSEGLLLLTNDGAVARHLELPATGWSRRYKVRVQGRVDEDKLASLANGITIDGVRYGEVIAELETQMTSNAWLIISIREGKNREVRRIMEHLGYRVSRLIRLSYGPFQLGRLEKGQIEEVRRNVLKEQLGAEDSKSAMAGLEGPLPRTAKKPRRANPSAKSAEKNNKKPTLKLQKKPKRPQRKRPSGA